MYKVTPKFEQLHRCCATDLFSFLRPIPIATYSGGMYHVHIVPAQNRFCFHLTEFISTSLEADTAIQ